MLLTATYLSKEDLPFPTQQFERLDLSAPTGQRIAHVIIRPAGYTKLSPEEIDLVGEHILRLLAENPIEFPDREYDATPPSWISMGSTAGGGGRSRSSSDGAIIIPAGAQFEANGEIKVPPRSEDNGDPAKKKFRRACRSVRNRVREMAEKTGRTVEQIMLELTEKK